MVSSEDSVAGSLEMLLGLCNYPELYRRATRMKLIVGFFLVLYIYIYKKLLIEEEEEGKQSAWEKICTYTIVSPT